ncbi:hypothetical protein D3C81_1969020 [compost metagenome]
MDALIGHHHLDLPLRDLLDRTGLTDEGVATLQRTELPLPEDLPAATVVVADASGTGRKDRSLHRFQVTSGHIEAEFVHRLTPSGSGSFQRGKLQPGDNGTLPYSCY